MRSAMTICISLSLLTACSAVRVQVEPPPGQPQTRSVLVYLFEANRLDEAERLALKLHAGGTHSPDIHLVLGKIYFREKKNQEMVHELELFMKEAPDSPLRREAQKILAGR